MLEWLVAPMPPKEFLDTYWTKQFVRIPGPPSKFEHLFSWSVLNRALEEYRCPSHAGSSRLELIKAGRRVTPELYLDGTCLNASGLTSELSNGATLLFNSCEVVHQPLQDLCCYLERLFHASVYVNLYAGWRTDNCFDIHWDTQDTLILQVSGRKHWQIWPATRRSPFKNDVVDTSARTKPIGPPLWDGDLEQGDMLSIPRGWWHVAHPKDEPSLHLTVTVPNLHGIDLLHWFADQMTTSEAARMAIPFFASVKDRRTWVDAVWRDVSTAWTPDLVERYVADVDGRARPRPSLRLPALAAAAMLGRHSALQLAHPRALHLQSSNGVLSFSAARTDWQAAHDLEAALASLNDGLPHTLGDLPHGDDPRLITLLTALVMAGVLKDVTP